MLLDDRVPVVVVIGTGFSRIRSGEQGYDGRTHRDRQVHDTGIPRDKQPETANQPRNLF